MVPKSNIGDPFIKNQRAGILTYLIFFNFLIFYFFVVSFQLCLLSNHMEWEKRPLEHTDLILYAMALLLTGKIK